MGETFEPREFRSALGSFATGVTIVTTRDADGRDIGLTANSFNSVSLDPPMVLWSLAKSSGSLAAFSSASHFAVHILAADQEPLSNRFAGKGADKFAELDLRRGDTGVPLLVGCAALFQCRTTYAYEGGDHVIFVGEVENFEHSAKPPLLYHGGRYALAKTKPVAEALDGEMGGSGLGNLITRIFMQLVAPVRRQSDQLGLSSPERHMMNVLLAGGTHDLAALNEIIDHTGTTASREVADGLVARGLVEQVVEGDGAEPGYRLTAAGREPLIRLLAAARANEADAMGGLSEDEQEQLGELLTRLLSRLTATGDEKVTRHMELLKSGLVQASRAG